MNALTLRLFRRTGAGVLFGLAAVLAAPAANAGSADPGHGRVHAAPADGAWLSAALLLPAEPQRPVPRVVMPVERRGSDPNTQAFQRADTDGDRMLSRAEAERIPGLAERFDEVDADKDGYISPEEFAKAMTV